MASTIKTSLPQLSIKAQNWGKGLFKSRNYTIKGEGIKELINYRIDCWH